MTKSAVPGAGGRGDSLLAAIVIVCDFVCENCVCNFLAYSEG